MKYNDYTDQNMGEKWVNGRYVGIRVGSPLQDAANPGVDSHDEAIRNSEHFGTITSDAAEKISFEEKK